MMPMFDVHGFILVGGASTRMGTDKAQLKLGNFTTVEVIGKALQGVTQSVTTVGWTEAKASHFPNIPDLRRDWGPLAGIEAALRHAQSTHSLIVGCDFPFVTAQLFERLIELTHNSDALVPLQKDGRPQPLCAVYRVQTCLPATELALAAEEHSPRALLDRVRTNYLPYSEISHLDRAEHFFFNVNTPENYRRAQEIFGKGLV